MTGEQERHSEASTQQNVGAVAGYEVAFSEGVRQLEHQERALDELRSRAGTLLAAAALATSFLGAAAMGDGNEWTVLAFVAVIAFAVTLLFCLVVLWPLTEWRFVNDPRKVIGDFIEADAPASIGEIHRELAIRAGEHAEHNKTRLRWLYSAFEAAVVGLLVQVLAWLSVLWGGPPA